MRTSAIVLSLCAVLTAGFVVGCGSSGSSDTTPSVTAAAAAATVPDGKLNASTAPPKLGYYAGLECRDSSCSNFDRAAEGYSSYCHGGKPNAKYPSSFTYQGHEENYVCFTLQSANQLVDFYFADAKIVRSVHVSSDRFPETCDNGYCISGEWFSTRSESGQIRNPNGVRSNYKTVWIGS